MIEIVSTKKEKIIFASELEIFQVGQVADAPTAPAGWAGDYIIRTGSQSYMNLSNVECSFIWDENVCPVQVRVLLANGISEADKKVNVKIYNKE